jgi:hypothetical protein
MKQPFLVVLALTIFTLAIQVNGQDKDSSDKTWPSLVSAEKQIDEAQPRFLLESPQLQPAQNTSNPLGVTRCRPGADGCIVWIRVDDFFSEWKGTIKASTLRADVMMHHYPQVLFDGHYVSTGTYVFYLPKQKVFYLWGDCAMGHADELAGPFSGDPRFILKKLAADPESLVQLGFLFVPFQSYGQGPDSGNKAWPTVPGSGIDISKLEAAQRVVNPLSLDRCRAASDACVLTINDFSVPRRNKWGKETWVLRPNVLVHYYPGRVAQYVFYLPERNIFYVAGYVPSSVQPVVRGPFAGDPRLILKKLGAGAGAK